jgi:LPXTG-motif cell wall-anchored protein
VKRLVFVIAAAAALVPIGVAPAAAGSDDKVVICHIPPGNPENAHTIVVSENALPAHLAHGDTEGPCPTYPPRSESLVAPSTVAPGASFQATFVGCAGGEDVNVVLDGKTKSGKCKGPAGSTRLPNQAGLPSATVTLVAPTTPGTYTIVATGEVSGLSATASITVQAAAAGGALPATGSDSAPTVQIAAGLLAVGAGLTVVGIRRRRAHA